MSDGPRGLLPTTKEQRVSRLGKMLAAGAKGGFTRRYVHLETRIAWIRLLGDA
ncbi:hypothetical protein K0M31_002184 [Melipona bicolor]|uniref:Uncharacterized protein n=1 Tax=Melipona bicolor TaxID=60889 RepID=A0AA40KYY3_9HYME|nr:hypothetical protein K0M31_002184 [Melipona bicolor]